jgi:pullulanase/glycogen debranching enzyme
VDSAGNAILGSGLDYGGQPAGYTQDPQENIAYVDAHDNQTFFDAIQLRAAAATSLDDRVRMHNMAVDLVMLSQGVPFFQAGQDILRSKSFDHNSYDSGDWFNHLDFTYTSNNFGVGLPPAWDNQGDWPLEQPLLADPSLQAGPDQIRAASRHFREMLQIRKSSRLFRLRTGAEVLARLSFLNTGLTQIPGVIGLRLSDAALPDLDPQVEEILVIFNATTDPQSITEAALAQKGFRLHEVQKESDDAVVKQSLYDRVTGTFTVPARTTAVFVSKGH